MSTLLAERDRLDVVAPAVEALHADAGSMMTGSELQILGPIVGAVAVTTYMIGQGV